MKKHLLLIILLTIFFSTTIGEVFAIDEDKTCNYNSKAYLNKLAGKVEAAVNFKYEEDGSVSFDISLYNIRDEVYVVIEDSMTKESFNVFPSTSTNGTYTFNVKDTSSIIKYTITVRTLSFGCNHDIRKFYVTKPKKNVIHDLEVCKKEEVADYFYCQEWITDDFSLSYSAIEDKINKKLKEAQKTTTTRCISCEINKEQTAEKVKKDKIKRYIIMALIIAIIIDFIFIMWTLIRIRRYSI